MSSRRPGIVLMTIMTGIRFRVVSYPSSSTRRAGTFRSGGEEQAWVYRLAYTPEFPLESNAMTSYGWAG